MGVCAPRSERKPEIGQEVACELHALRELHVVKSV